MAAAQPIISRRMVVADQLGRMCTCSAKVRWGGVAATAQAQAVAAALQGTQLNLPHRARWMGAYCLAVGFKAAPPASHSPPHQAYASMSTEQITHSKRLHPCSVADFPAVPPHASPAGLRQHVHGAEGAAGSSAA